MSLSSLIAIVGARVLSERRDWWNSSIDGATDRGRLTAAFAGAGRRLGAVPVVLTAAEHAVSGPAAVLLEGRPLDECARVAILATGLQKMPATDHVAIVHEIYRTGDLAEKQAVLRTLSLLSEPARFLVVAGEGVRTSVTAILESLACENPYPSVSLPDDVWNQMIMKAVFNNLSLARVTGLAARCTPELARMARDFAAERRAAGRVVPADLALIGLPQEELRV